MDAAQTHIDPVPPPAPERIPSLDVLRGIALTGILVMNITSFALPGTAYSNPMAYGGDSGLNHLVFSLTHLFFDQKMMGLFSLLFGASAMLFMEKLRTKGISATAYYYSRMLWLIGFGILHGVLLWEGDILFFYGLCGLLLYFFRWFPAPVNLLLGLAMFLGAIAVGEHAQQWVNSLSEPELKSISWAWQPEPRQINYEINLRKSDYGELLGYRWETSEINPTYPVSNITKWFLIQGIMRAFGLMLVGMALYRWQVFRGDSYKKSGGLLLAMGLLIAGTGLRANYQHHWDIHYSFYHGHFFNHLATPIIVLGYTLLLIHFVNRHRFRLISWFANYGRMAFTNYLMQSLICTTLFYGYGLAWFARFNRLELLLLVTLIVVVQLIFSNIWLHYFRYGPLEWFWRLCTFFRLPSRLYP